MYSSLSAYAWCLHSALDLCTWLGRACSSLFSSPSTMQATSATADARVQVLSSPYMPGGNQPVSQRGHAQLNEVRTAPQARMTATSSPSCTMKTHTGRRAASWSSTTPGPCPTSLWPECPCPSACPTASTPPGCQSTSSSSRGRPQGCLGCTTPMASTRAFQAA